MTELVGKHYLNFKARVIAGKECVRLVFSEDDVWMREEPCYPIALVIEPRVDHGMYSSE